MVCCVSLSLISTSTRRKKLPKPVDLSALLDFKLILQNFNETGVLPDGIRAAGADSPVFCIENRPGKLKKSPNLKSCVKLGSKRLSFLLENVWTLECWNWWKWDYDLYYHTGFYFIPGALSLKEQCKWIKESLTNFPQPPNRTNHNAIYGPIADLFDSAKANKVLVQEDPPTSETCIDTNKWKFCDDVEEEDIAKAKRRNCKSVSASVLLRKLRWSTLGLQFDWSKVKILQLVLMKY